MDLESQSREQLIERIRRLEQSLGEAKGQKSSSGSHRTEPTVGVVPLEAIFDTASIGLVQVAVDDGRFLRVNRRYCEITGYDSEELYQMRFSDLTHPEDRERDWELFSEAVQNRVQSYKNEKRYVRKDGSVAWVRLNISLITNNDHNVAHAFEICEDITVQKRAEMSLQDNERRYRTTLDNMLEGCQIVGFDWRYLYVNEAVAKHGRISREDLVGHTMMEVYPGIERTGMFAKLDQCMRSRSAVSFENDFEFGDGSVGRFALSVQPVPEGIFILSIDRTEQFTAEEELRRQNAKLLALTNSNIVGIVLAGSDGRIFHANEYFLDLLGFTAEEFKQGKVDWRKLTPDQWLEADDKALHQLMEYGACTPYEKEYYRIDGSRVPVLLAETVVPGSENLIAAFVLDITLQKQSEKAVKNSEALLSKIFESSPIGINLFRISDNQSFLVNDAFLDIIGYRRQEVLGHSAAELDLFVDQEARVEWMQSLKRKERILNQIARIRTKTGYIRYVMASLDIINFYGEPIVLVVMLDITDKKAAEDLVVESEHKFRSVTEQSFTGITIIQDGMFKYVNPRWTEIFGYSADEAVDSLSPLDVVHPDYREIARKKQSRVISRQKDHYSYELVGITKSGRQIDMEIFGSSITYNGKPAILGTLLDITERKTVEKMLREERQRLHGIIKGTRSGTWEWNIQSGEVTVNERWAEIIGYTVEDFNAVTMRNLEELCHPDDIQTSREILNLHLGGELDYYECEIRIRHKNGRWVHVVDRGSIVSRAQDGTPLVMMGTRLDISKNKKIEELQRESETRFRTLFDQAAVGVVRAARTGVFLEVNDKFCEIVGYSRPELFAMTVFDITHEDDLHLDNLFVDRVKNGEIDSWEAEKRYIHKDGHSVWVRVHSNVIRDESGYAMTAVAVVADISHRIEHENERRKLEEQLNQAQKMEAVGRLAGGVAHDFNNILTVINGYSEHLLSLKIPEDLKIPLEEIHKAGDRAKRLTAQLLAFSRKQILQPIILNLNNLVESQMKMLGRLLGEDIEISTLLSPESINIKADPGQLDQVIMNIAINARDAMPLGGKLTIETAVREFDEGYTKDHIDTPAGNFAMLAISDTGSGIPEEIKANIFEPFFTTKDRDKGTGLGLATVYGIVKQNNGFIYVYSEEDQGTTFKIYLPLLERQRAEVEQGNGDTELLQGTETILFVEDEPGVRAVTEQSLTKYGYRVFTATNGEEGLRMFKENSDSIDLVLTDVIMPLMGGKELSQGVLREKPEVKIIFSSGYTDNSIVHHGVLDEEIEFIQKPYSPKELMRKIRMVLDA